MNREQHEQFLAAAQRMLRIKKSQVNILDFIQLMMPDPSDPDDVHKSRFEIAAHHRLMAEALQKVAKGEITRLCVSLAPRHGKSEMFSRMFPAWFMGQDPRHQVVVAGASTDFAVAEFGRKIKQIMTSPMYAQVFPKASLDGGSASVENLVTTEGGNVKSIGKGAQIVGRGAHLLVLDDVIAGVEEANSPTERNKLWEWFTTDAMSRLMPKGRVVIIHQRWHNSDLIGRLVDPDCPEYDPRVAKLWTHIKLPAVIEDERIAKALGIELKAQTDPDIVDQFGSKPIAALWEDRYPLRFFAELKRPNPRRFEALYQGRPRLDEGNFFKLEWLRPYRPQDLPKNLRKYTAADFAISTKQTADKTCIISAGIDEQGTIWILPDLFWERANSDAIIQALITTMRQHRPLALWAEKGHISQSLGPIIRKRMNEESVYCSIIEKTPVKDKLSRAQAFNALCSMGRVRFPVFAHWWRNAESELLRFPEGSHDDFVDACSWLGIGLQQLVPASHPTTQNHKAPKTGTLAWVKQSAAWENRNKRSAFSQGF